MTISRFFAPRKSNTKSTFSKKPKTSSVVVREDDDGWEKPIGLTKKYAITIDDNTDNSSVSTSGGAHDASKDDIHSQSSSNHQEHIIMECEAAHKFDVEISEDKEVHVSNTSAGPDENIINIYGMKSGSSSPSKNTNMESQSATYSTDSAENANKGTKDEEDSNREESDNKGIRTLCSMETNLQKDVEVTQIKTVTEKTNDEVTTNEENPFLQFAYDLGGSESSYFTSLSTSIPTSSNLCELSTSADASAAKDLASQTGFKNRSYSKKKDAPSDKNRGSTSKFVTTTTTPKATGTANKNEQGKKRKRTMKKITEDDIEFKDMTQEQLTKCRRKWQSFADEEAPVQIKRFQVLVAARLHCQAHDSTVRRAMVDLRKLYSNQNNDETETTTPTTPTPTPIHCESDYRYLCPNSLSSACPDEISKIISSVLFANVKSKQIIKAANEIKSQFHGNVPETIKGMQMITGIGPKLAQLLFYVNSIAAYEPLAMNAE